MEGLIFNTRTAEKGQFDQFQCLTCFIRKRQFIHHLNKLARTMRPLTVKKMSFVCEAIIEYDGKPHNNSKRVKSHTSKCQNKI